MAELFALMLEVDTSKPKISPADVLPCVTLIDLDSDQCDQVLHWFIAAHPDVWTEDIGE